MLHHIRFGAFFVVIAASSAAAQEPPKSKELIEVAKEAFASVSEECQRGELNASSIELLATWSRRIVLYQTSFSDEWRAAQLAGGIPESEDFPKQWYGAIRDHIQRMTNLEKVAQKRFAAGVASNATVIAAKFARLEAEFLRETIEFDRTSFMDNLEIPLPKPSQAKPQPEAKQLVLQVRQDGQIRMDDKVVEDVDAVVKKFTAAHSVAEVVVRAHRSVKFRRIKELVRICKKYQARLWIHAIPEEESRK